MEEEIVNRVAASGLVSLDLKDWYPQGPRLGYDLAQNLFQGLILREKDFRQFLTEHDWSQYAGANVHIWCSADAIIPQWAYMLLATRLQGVAAYYCFGTLEQLEQALWQQVLAGIDASQYRGQRVIIKGCSDVYLPNFVWTEVSRKLLPEVQSLMYGEPCSNVPVYKKSKASATQTPQQ